MEKKCKKEYREYTDHLEKSIEQMSKLRFMRKNKGIMMEEYLKKLPLSLSKAVIRTRLNMVKAKSNYKGSNRNDN